MNSIIGPNAISLEITPKEIQVEPEYYDASHHGLLLMFVYELLHAIVLIYCLYGMIHFKVKFISIHYFLEKLVKGISYLLIAHGWYMSIKFAFIFVNLYLFMFHLEYYRLDINQFNCTLTDSGPINSLIQHQWNTIDRSNYITRVLRRFRIYKIIKWNYIGLGPEWFQGLIPVVDYVCGPYTWLGYRAVVVFGFFSVSFLILLAVFPLELYMEDHSFNYIRFVLNDTTCLKELYELREKHLKDVSAYIGLNSWTKTAGDKVNEAELAFNFNRWRRLMRARTLDNLKLLESMLARPPTQQRGSRNFLLKPWRALQKPLGKLNRVRPLQSKGSRAIHLFGLSPTATNNNLMELGIDGLLALKDDHQLRWPRSVSAKVPGFMLPKTEVGYLLAKLSFLHQKQQQQRSFQLENIINDRLRERRRNIAATNESLKKFVPHVRSEVWFKLSMILYPIFIFFYFILLLFLTGIISWQIITQVCDVSKTCYSKFGVNISDLSGNWFNRITFYDFVYAAPALGVASSFYCSFYFGTMLELFIWGLELNQQLSACIQSVYLLEQSKARGKQQMQCWATDSNYENLDWELNEFGGLSKICYHLWWQAKADVSICESRRRAWALHHIKKREALFEATYINFNLFLDEHEATRHLSEKILFRTTQIAIAFAFLVSISHLQFQRSVLRMAMLLGVSQLILNLYLWSAALVNTMGNKIIHKMQKLNPLCLRLNRPDLANIFAGYVGEHGFETNEFAYVIFNEKITWQNIFNFNGKITSAYMFTLK